jgi:hypothetical protein
VAKLLDVRNETISGKLVFEGNYKTRSEESKSRRWGFHVFGDGTDVKRESIELERRCGKTAVTCIVPGIDSGTSPRPAEPAGITPSS